MFLIPPTEIDTTSCRLHLSAMAHDYDWVIVGSGFGGSVSALRLAEKGYKVAVIEVGRRFEDKAHVRVASFHFPLSDADRTDLQQSITIELP